MSDADNKVITETEKKENNGNQSTSVPGTVDTKTVEEQPKESQDQINWKAFRDQREKERKEKIALEQEAAKKSQEIAALKAAMEAIVSKPEPVLASQSDEEETDEQRMQKQIDSAVAAALKQKEAREAKERAERESKEVPQRLEQSFPDFDKVCSTENLDRLEFDHPEVAEAFKGQIDSFHKWANIYKAIKRYIPNAATSTKDLDKKADKNLSKPQSMSIPGMSTTGDSAPRKIDDKAREANWARMQRVMKGLS